MRFPKTVSRSFLGGSLLLAAFSYGGPCQGQDIFATAGQNVPVAEGPSSFVLGDVNRDGHPDLVAATWYGGVSVRFGDGTGAFAEVGQNVPIGGEADSIALGDVDLDDDLDLVTANRSNSTCSVRLNDGTGSFGTTGPEIVVGNGPWGVLLEDIDGDDLLDLIAVTTTAVKVYPGDGTGTFATLGQEVPVPGAAREAALGDLDGDGDLDLVSVSYHPIAPGSCSVRLNEGGVFASTGQEVPVGIGPWFVALADANSDGDLDLVTANAEEPTCSVRFGDGLGGFATAGQEVPIGSSSFCVAMGDVDQDGFVDLVAANLWASSCSVRLNDGTGLFATSGQEISISPWLSVDFTMFVALEDLDADGDLDLACAFVFGFGSDFVSVRHNVFDLFRRLDINHDGQLDVADPIYLIEYLFYDGDPVTCEDAGDTNDDGALDIADSIYGLSYLFSAGPAPVEPFSACGADPTDDGLTCASFTTCP